MNPLLTIGPPLPSCLQRPPVTPWRRMRAPFPRFSTTVSHTSALCAHKNAETPASLQIVPTVAKAKTGRPTKPAALKRSSWLKVRVSEDEKKLVKARAAASGLGVSDYIRGLAILGGPAVVRQAAQDRTRRKAERQAPGDFEALVARYEQTMPRRNAEIVARRELARS